jgi:hypothetical protein
VRSFFRRALPLGLFLAAFTAIPAQQPQVRARVEPDRVTEGSEVSLVIEISGSSQAPDEPPDLSQLPGFSLAGGPSVSTFFQWVNGRTSASRTYTYVLLPQGRGTRPIPPLEVKLGGQVYRTEPLRVEVVARGSTFSDPGTRRRIAPPPTVPSQLFVEAKVDKPEVYPGEQVTLIYKVDTQFEIAQMSLKDQPTYQGFWVEDIKTDDKDGKYDARPVQRPEGNFIEYTVLKKALFPTNPGTFTIPPLTFHFAVRRRGNDPFDSFFFQPTESLFRASEAVTIRVKELPLQGRPREFTGAVGRFTMEVTPDRKASRVNDAVGLRVRVEGQGNVSTLQSPILPEIHDFKRYEPKVEESVQAKGGTLVGSKTWNYVLIPLAPGEQEIPPVRFAYFDPQTAQYRVLQEGPIRLSIAKGDLSEMPAQAIAGRSEIPVLGSDIRYIKLAGRHIEDEGGDFFASRAFMAVLAAPLLLNLALLAVARRRSSRAGQEGQLRSRRAARMAKKRLSRARARLIPGESRHFYQELASALTAYLADKVGVPASGLTYDRIEEILAARGVTEETRQRFRRSLEACDFARFAPSSSEKEEMERAAKNAGEVIEELETAGRPA